jgi:DNA-binding CsgD family transcriptional regulator
MALEDATDPRDRAALLVTAATAGRGAAAGRIRVSAAQQLQAIGDDSGAVHVLDAAIAGDDELQALRAAVLAESLSRLGRQVEAWDVISAAEGLRPDPRSDASIELALSRASALVNVHGRLADGIEVLEQTVALGSPAGRPLQVRGLLATLRLLSGESGQVEELERVWSESLQAGDGATAASTAMNLDTGLLIERGAGPALAFAVEAARRLADLGLVGRASALRVEGTQVALFAGDLGEAVMLADGLLEEPLGPRPRCRLLAIRGLALAWLGRFDAARDSLAESETLATPEFEGLGEIHHGRAELALWSGRPERARSEAMAAVELPAISDANYVLPALTRSWAELELGRQPAALPSAPAMRVLAGASPEHAGIRALARDEPGAALAAFDEAAAAWAGFHRPRELICRWAAGESARRAGRADVAAARLETVLGEAEEVAGFGPLVARIRRSLRLAGVRVQARAPFGDGPGIGLTARERELVSLVERGLTNVEIARRLGLGRPTVARILASAMAKAGVDSRAQLAGRELG